MCAPRVTRNASIRYSSSCHAHINVGASIFFTAAVVRAFRSVRSRGNGGTNTSHKMHFAQYPQTYSCDIPTHKMTSPPEWPFSHYIHSHHLVAEMWTTVKNNLLWKKFLSYSFFLHRFRKYMSFGFPIINLCNPRVHYETPCIIIKQINGRPLDFCLHIHPVSVIVWVVPSICTGFVNTCPTIFL